MQVPRHFAIKRRQWWGRSHQRREATRRQHPYAGETGETWRNKWARRTLKKTAALLLVNMEFRTLLILGLCACVAIAAPTEEENENQGNGDSSDGSNENDVSAQEESDRRKLVAITRALDKIKDQLTDEEEDYLDDLLDDEDCEAAEDADDHDRRRKRGCRSCSISNCPHKDKKHCGVTCCNGRPKCKCSWWNGKAKCKCT